MGPDLIIKCKNGVFSCTNIIKQNKIGNLLIKKIITHFAKNSDLKEECLFN